jgi:acylglycerol lipase
MNIETGKFTGCNNTSLFYQSYTPEASIKAVLIVVHGLADHSGRFANVAKRFVPLGYAVYAFDMRGHGQSEGKRGTIDSVSCCIEDIHAFRQIVSGKHPGKKIFLLGHSIGGTVSVAYTVKHQNDISGLILSAPVMTPGRSFSPAVVAIAKFLAKIAPGMGIQKISAQAISRDTGIVQAYINDPLVFHGPLTASQGIRMMKEMEALRRQIPTIALPLLVLYGTADKISDPESSTIIAANAGSTDKTIRAYDGLYHEIFNEPESPRVFQDIQDWLAKHT